MESLDKKITTEILPQVPSQPNSLPMDLIIFATSSDVIENGTTIPTNEIINVSNEEIPVEVNLHSNNSSYAPKKIILQYLKNI
jgi:hypothetical protein